MGTINILGEENSLDDFDLESQEQMVGLKYLNLNQVDFDGMQNGFNNTFQQKDPIKGFDEIAYEKKYGKQEKCSTPKNEFYKGSMDIYSLVTDLKSNKEYKQFFFYYQKYLKTSFNNSGGISPTVMAPQSIGGNYESTPFTYKNEYNQTVNAKLDVALNRRACHLNVSNPGFIFSIDKDEITLKVRYTYQDSLGKRKANELTKANNDFTINDEFEGVIITTSSANDFLALSDQIGHRSFIENEIKNLFIEKLRQTNTGKELKFLYENIPDFVIKTLSNELKEDLLWNHFILLTEYDDTGILSGWRDGSSALINVLKAFGKSKTLFEKFKDNPKIVKRVYNNLDGFSVHENELVSNRLLYANLLTALCIDNQLEGLNLTSKKFYYGDDYKFETDTPNKSDNESDDQFFIKQIRLIPLFGADILYPLTTEIDEDDGFMYHPLDIVFFEDTSTQDAIVYPVPAIFVRALGDEEKRQETETNIRIGFDILAILIGSFVSATTGNPVVFALAVADIGLAVIDGGVQAYRTEILKLEGGKEFVDTWEKIYLFGGIALASPTLINIILNAGPRLLKFATAAKNFKAANFLKTCLLKVLLEIEIANFTKNTVKEIIYGEEALRSSGISFNFAGITRLQEQGVLFIKGIGFDDKIVGYAAVHKGETIASGTAKEVREALKELWTARGIKLVEKLDELYDVANFVSRYAIKLKTNINEAFFWSGRTNGIGGEEIALDIAKAKNGITLEGLIKKNNIAVPIWNPFDKKIMKIWSLISKRYAEQVSGEIRAVIGSRLRENNIWEAYELPALKANSNVTKITIIDPKTKVEKLIFRR